MTPSTPFFTAPHVRGGLDTARRACSLPIAAAALAALGGLAGGCGGAEQPAEATTGFAISVAPLSLANIDDACYSLTVFGGPSTGDGVVWSQEHVCSSRYGDARGSIAYVGACDATAGGGSGESLVRLVMDDLCSGGPCPASRPGPTSLADSEWRNPCPGPDGCTRRATCAPDSDTPVSFDLVVARAAHQGFFDVAVEFSDVYCSAKLDCQGADHQPLSLLFDPATGQRGPTVVVAWACTGGPGSETWLYDDNLVVTCFDDEDDLIGSWAYDPSLGPGNIGPGSAPFVFQAATYRTVEAGGVASWNMALGIRPDDLPGRCVLTAAATASDGFLDGYLTPEGSTYPIIRWDVTLSEAAGALSCTQHPLDGGNGVFTDYVRGAPKAFSHAMSAADKAVSSRGRVACGAVVESLDGRVSFAASPEGVTARVGSDQSPFYKLPAGRTLVDCCGDLCCEAQP